MVSIFGRTQHCIQGWLLPSFTQVSKEGTDDWEAERPLTRPTSTRLVTMTMLACVLVHTIPSRSQRSSPASAPEQNTAETCVVSGRLHPCTSRAHKKFLTAAGSPRIPLGRTEFSLLVLMWRKFLPIVAPLETRNFSLMV